VTELPADDVFTTLETSRRGLSRTQAEDRLRTHGGNELPRAAPRAVWRQLAAQFTDLFAVMLLAASGITFLAYVLEEPRDAGTLTLALAILGVVGLNAAIGFAQEYSAERTAQALEAMIPHICRVLRDGRSSRPSSATAGPTVPHPQVRLRAGDEILLVSHSATEHGIHAAFQRDHSRSRRTVSSSHR